MIYLLVALVIVLPVALLGALACGKDLLALAIAVPTVALHAWAMTEAIDNGSWVILVAYQVALLMIAPISLIGREG